jgi:hypothetical protein
MMTTSVILSSASLSKLHIVSCTAGDLEVPLDLLDQAWIYLSFCHDVPFHARTFCSSD